MLTEIEALNIRLEEAENFIKMLSEKGKVMNCVFSLSHEFGPMFYEEIYKNRKVIIPNLDGHKITKAGA